MINISIIPKWVITIRATDLQGKPVRARVTMRLLFAGVPVGKVDNGRVYSFTGTWREKKGQEIEFPLATTRIARKRIPAAGGDPSRVARTPSAPRRRSAPGSSTPIDPHVAAGAHDFAVFACARGFDGVPAGLHASPGRQL